MLWGEKEIFGSDHLECLGLDRDNIKIALKEIGWGGVGWNHVARDRDKWRKDVKTLMIVRAPYIAGEFHDQLRNS